MAPTRLLAAALVLCGFPVLAQDKQPTPEIVVERPLTQIDRQIPDLSAAHTSPSEAWLVVRNQPAELTSGKDMLPANHLEQPRLSQSQSDPRLQLKVETLDADATCYTLRTYVVARDSKDSDSTHPAGYSTCQPSAQYQLKTTVLRSGTQDR